MLFHRLYYFEQEKGYFLLNQLTWKSGEISTGEFVKDKLLNYGKYRFSSFSFEYSEIVKGAAEIKKSIDQLKEDQKERIGKSDKGSSEQYVAKCSRPKKPGNPFIGSI